MDDNKCLRKICKELERETTKSSFNNEISLVRKKISEYINGDRDKYLQLKAEVDFAPIEAESNNTILSTLGFVMASISLVLSTVLETDMAQICLACYALILIITLYYLQRNRKIHKWKKYILAVISEFEI